MGCERTSFSRLALSGSVRVVLREIIGLVLGASCPFLSAVSETNRIGHSMDSPG